MNQSGLQICTVSLSLEECLRLRSRRTENEAPDLHAFLYPFNYLQLVSAAASSLAATRRVAESIDASAWRVSWLVATVPRALAYVVCDWTLRRPWNARAAGARTAMRDGVEPAPATVEAFSVLLSRIGRRQIVLLGIDHASLGVRQSASPRINALVDEAAARIADIEAAADPTVMTRVQALCEDIRQAMRCRQAEPAREMLSGFYCHLSDFSEVDSLDSNVPSSGGDAVDSAGTVKNLSWPHVLDALLPQREVALFTKFQGAVALSRTWDPRIGGGVWSKAYRNGFDLAAFNEWEFDVLRRLEQLKVDRTYRAVRLERDVATASRDAAPAAQLVIRTLHAGPTLADLVRMPTMTGAGLRAHPFVEPARFLQLVRSLLVALQSVHQLDFVHCDIHGGNIAMPIGSIHATGSTGAPDRVQGELRIDALKLIDFGFSIDRRSPPPTTLPFMRKAYGRQLSPRFASLLRSIDEEAQKQLPHGERWVDVMFDPVFWRQLDPSPLGQLCHTDWREDIFQLGGMLADLRDGRGEFELLEGRLIEASSASQVGQLIDHLPEAMKTAGCGDGLRRSHSEWISQIDRALDQLRRAGRAPGEWVIDVHRHAFSQTVSRASMVQIVQPIDRRPRQAPPSEPGPRPPGPSTADDPSARGNRPIAPRPDVPAAELAPLSSLPWHPSDSDSDSDSDFGVDDPPSLALAPARLRQPRIAGRRLILLILFALAVALIVYVIASRDAGLIDSHRDGSSPERVAATGRVAGVVRG